MDLKKKFKLIKRNTEELVNEEELKIASGDFHSRPQGLEYQNPTHFYSLDIDLFGRGSFFQYINRTSINEGTKKLADELTANNIENIKLCPCSLQIVTNGFK